MNLSGGGEAVEPGAGAPENRKGILGLPAVGYGVSGPLGSVLMSDRAVIDLIDRAYSAGIRLFDSAPFYGLAQGRLGAWLARADPGPGEVLLASKCGTVRRNGRMEKDWRLATLSAQIDRTRAEFGGRAIDFLFLHGVPPRESLPGIGAFLRDQQVSGAVIALGLCARWHDDWAHALDHLPLTSMMAPLHPGSATDLANAQILAARGLAFLAIETMHVPHAGLRYRLNGADLWRDLQTLRRARFAASLRPQAPADRSALLRAAVESPWVTTALMTSAAPNRLARNLAVLADWSGRIAGP